MAKLGWFKLGSLWGALGGTRTIGRALRPWVFTRSYRDMFVKTEGVFAVFGVEAKPYRDVSVETREVEP